MKPEDVPRQPLVALRALDLDVLAAKPEVQVELLQGLELKLAVDARAGLAAVFLHVVVQVKHRVIGVLGTLSL